jgi:predicted glycoside hydrolase/deacetylase ChbG (UPF0249 family)
VKPAILVIADVPGWALDRTADNVIRRLGDRFRFIKVFNGDAVSAIGKDGFDLLYVTYEWQFQDAGIDVNMIPEYSVTGVRSHFKWDGGRGLRPSSRFLRHLERFRAIHVPSKILYDIFKPLHGSVFQTPHGVDVEVFRPAPSGPLASPKGELVLGWAGSLTNHPGKRGMEDFIIPALEGLSGVSLRLAAREQKWRNQEEMVEFYQGLDALICASRTEGGPHPVLEASACAVPVISTAVGIAPELITSGENGIIIERQVVAIREAVLRLRDDRELRIAMGEKARRVVEERWNWDILARRYIPFFERGLGQDRADDGRKARHMVTGRRCLIVNADDYNTDPERNRGILEAARKGVVTSVSVLANLTEDAETLRGLHASVGTAVGVHLNLTRGRPLAPDVPTLTDRNGMFFAKGTAWRKALLGRFDTKDVEKEFAAQIERLKALGTEPDHIDGNNHIHVFPKLSAIVAGLARDFGIPSVRLPKEPFRNVCDRFVPGAGVKSLLSFLSRRASKEFRRNGLWFPHHFAGIGFPHTSDIASLKEFVASLPDGVTELMCHPGYPAVHNPFSSPEREQELRALTDESLRRHIARLGVRLIPFGERP